MILADSGFWIALGNRRDRHHEAAKRALAKYSDEGFVSTWPVLTEVTHLLSARVGIAQSIAFVDGISRGACDVPDPPTDALVRAYELMSRYRDLPMGGHDVAVLSDTRSLQVFGAFVDAEESVLEVLQKQAREYRAMLEAMDAK